MNLFDELKRRNVLRVAAAYLVLSWLLLQVGDVLFEALDVPDWGLKLLIGLLAIGLAPVVIFSWVYELTPEGLRKESEVDRSVSATPQTGRRLDRLTLGMLLVVAALIIGDRLLPERSTTASSDTRPTASTVEPQPTTAPEPVAAPGSGTARSIAVLPFVSMSDSTDDEYFADGISEELLNILAKIPQLKVAGRTSSFRYKGIREDLRTIGEELGVEYLLEGSIRRSGEQVRITGQLIQVSDGFHLWSETFDRKLEDVFVLQDQIVRTIVQALKVQLVSDAVGRDRSHVDPVAHNHVLKGRYYWAERHVDGNRALAVQEFELATSVAPDYADAWAGLGQSIGLSDPSVTTRLPEAEHLERAKAAFQRALALDPDNVEALSGHGYVLTKLMEWDPARRHIQAAVERAPGYPVALYLSAYFHRVTGASEESIRLHRRAIALDPHNLTMKRTLMQFLAGLGRYQEASVLQDELLRLGGNQAYSQTVPYMQALERRDVSALTTLLERAKARSAEGGAPPGSQGFLHTWESATLALQGDRSRWDALVVDMDGSGKAWLSQFAYLVGDYDLAVDGLEYSVRTFDVFDSGNWIFSIALKPGDPFLSHPRYRALWQIPGMPELAALRRANGALWGLPEPTAD
jgi:TolB-like protein/tetratricopeptide (TPR) repeat protein